MAFFTFSGSPTYNRLGQLLTANQSGAATSPDADYTFGYNANTLRFASETVTIDPDGSDSLPSLTRTIDRSRDNLQRPTGFVLGNEHAVGYGYDVSGRLATISAQGLPNLPGKSHAFEYTYEPGSSLIDKVTGPVHEVDNDYETHRNILLQKKNTRTIGTPGDLSIIGYTVNELGQRVQRNLRGEIRAEFYGGQVADPYATNWGYDALGQVTSEDKPSTTADRGYSYDLIGNRLTSTADSATTTYASNSLNQYSQISVPSVQSVVPIHDADGNMTTGLLNGSTSGQFEYDGENQLIRTQATSASDPTRYAYDAFGRRTAKVTYPNSGGTATAATLFIYDGWNLIAEYNLDSGAWTQDRTYIWGIDLSGATQGAGGVGGLLSVTKRQAQNTTHFYPIYDGNGNIEAYLDSNGSPTAIYQYDAFGNVLSGEGKGAATEQIKFSHRFSSKCLDAETGFLYYGYRYFDAQAGRWLNRDPIGERGGLNIYGFLGANGIGKVDVLGLAEAQYHHWMPQGLKDKIQAICPFFDIDLITTPYGPKISSSGTPHDRIHHAAEVVYNTAYAAMLNSLQAVDPRYRCCALLMGTEVIKDAVHLWLTTLFPNNKWVPAGATPPLWYYPYANPEKKFATRKTDDEWRKQVITRCACVPPDELDKVLKQIRIPLAIPFKQEVPNYLYPEVLDPGILLLVRPLTALPAAAAPAAASAPAAAGSGVTAGIVGDAIVGVIVRFAFGLIDIRNMYYDPSRPPPEA